MNAARTTRLRTVCRTVVIFSPVRTTGTGRRTAANIGSPFGERNEKEVPVRRLAYSDAMPFERDEDLIEQLIDRQVLPGGTYLTFARDTVVTRDGVQRGRDIVLHPGAVTVVAILPDRQVLLVRQYRHPSGEVLLELPAGTLDIMGDGSTEEPLRPAKRELFEETGHRAQTWTKIGEFFTAPGFATELMHMYLATDVAADPSHEGPDEDERLFVETMPFDEALSKADDGTIRDAKTLVGLYLVDRLARAGKVKELSRS